jgi:hypothetical protein
MSETILCFDCGWSVTFLPISMNFPRYFADSAVDALDDPETDPAANVLSFSRCETCTWAIGHMGDPVHLETDDPLLKSNELATLYHALESI